MAVRMKDIAQDLGVSLMTVSKALRNHADIAEETRRRVRQRARELEYEPNLVARSLASRRTWLIGLVIPDMMHSFFADIAKGISRRMEPHGYQTLISNSGESAELELQQIKALLARNVDGLIIASAAPTASGPLFQLLSARNVRYVLIDRVVRNLEANYVGVNDERVGFLATEHLWEQGCRRVAHISGPAISTGRGRLRGYRRALAAHGLEAPPEYVVSGAHTDANGYTAMQGLLQLPAPPDGVFCFNDPVAAGVIKAVLEAGLKVPQDVAVVGAGNVHYSDLLRVPLSTIDQNSAGIGEAAAELLLECMESNELPSPRRVYFPPKLVLRESSKRK